MQMPTKKNDRPKFSREVSASYKRREVGMRIVRRHYHSVQKKLLNSIAICPTQTFQSSNSVKFLSSNYLGYKKTFPRFRHKNVKNMQNSAYRANWQTRSLPTLRSQNTSMHVSR